MTSFQLAVTPHRRAAARFVAKVRRRIQKAYADAPEITQAQIAKELGVHRAVINRQLRGTKDMTLGRVAELAYVLGYEAEFDLSREADAVGTNTPATAKKATPFKVQSMPSTGSTELKNWEKKFEIVK